MCMFPAEVGQGASLLSCFGSNTVNKVPFCGVLKSMAFQILLVILLPQMAPKCSAIYSSKDKMCHTYEDV